MIDGIQMGFIGLTGNPGTGIIDGPLARPFSLGQGTA
jgi:hypothetical protein